MVTVMADSCMPVGSQPYARLLQQQAAIGLEVAAGWAAIWVSASGAILDRVGDRPEPATQFTVEGPTPDVFADVIDVLVAADISAARNQSNRGTP